MARCENDEPILTIRLRDRQDRSAAEVDGLSDAFGCPAVPNLRLLTSDLLVLDYLPGTPCRFEDLDIPQIEQLAHSLSCIHETTYTRYTNWPERTMAQGSRADLLRFRIRSLANFESYPAAREGRIHQTLPELLDLLANPEITDPSWDEAEFSRLHGDLSYGNLIWHDDELALIDWEYSRVGDPAEDLAYLLVEQGVSLEGAKSLRQAYIDAEGEPEAWRRVPTYAVFAAVDSCLWWADYGAERDLPSADEIEARVATALNWIPLLDA
ncbi:MAG: phosphotransferase [Thermomicrobiales bacterium]